MVGGYQLPEPMTVTRCFIVCEAVIFAAAGADERFLWMRLSLRAAMAVVEEAAAAVAADGEAVRDLAAVAIEADDRLGGIRFWG
jgi:hypothetical protein